MNPEDELALIEVEEERRRRAKVAAAAPTAPVSDAGKEGRDEELQRRIDARPAYERSFATGAKQGVTFGFGDELAGVAGAAGDVFGKARDAVTGFGGKDEGFVEGAKRAYREANQLLGDIIKVHYEGKLLDGTVFDSSFERKQSAIMPLDGLVQAWLEALPMMKVGDEWVLYVPPELGYGDRDVGPIPAGSVMTFRLQLLGMLAVD